MRVCIPVTPSGQVDPRWGRAGRVAVAEVDGDTIASWEEFDVGWDRSHDAGGEGQHHARVARFLQEHRVEGVVADHMGPGMAQMLTRMGLAVRLGAAGDARSAVRGSAAVE